MVLNIDDVAIAVAKDMQKDGWLLTDTDTVKSSIEAMLSSIETNLIINGEDGFRGFGRFRVNTVKRKIFNAKKGESMGDGDEFRAYFTASSSLEKVINENE